MFRSIGGRVWGGAGRGVEAKAFGQRRMGPAEGQASHAKSTPGLGCSHTFAPEPTYLTSVKSMGLISPSISCYCRSSCASRSHFSGYFSNSLSFLVPISLPFRVRCQNRGLWVEMTANIHSLSNQQKPFSACSSLHPLCRLVLGPFSKQEN